MRESFDSLIKVIGLTRYIVLVYAILLYAQPELIQSIPEDWRKGIGFFALASIGFNIIFFWWSLLKAVISILFWLVVTAVVVNHAFTGNLGLDFGLTTELEKKIDGSKKKLSFLKKKGNSYRSINWKKEKNKLFGGHVDDYKKLTEALR